MPVGIIRGAPITSTHHTTIRRWLRTIYLGLLFILVIADTATRSFFIVIFFGDSAFGAGLMVSFCIIVIFIGISALHKDIFILMVFTAILGFFVFFYLYYLFGVNQPLNFNSLAGYYGVLTVIVFYEIARRNLLPDAMKLICIVYIIYLIAYSIMSLGDIFGLDISPTSSKVPIDLTDPNRGRRIYLFQGAAVYVAMYAFSRLQGTFRLGYMIALLVAGLAMYFSISRVLIISSILVLLVYLVTRRLKIAQITSFVLYMIVSGYLTLGVFDQDFNPFWFATTDASALARRYQYEFVSEYIRQYPLLGVGLAGATDGLTNYLGKVIYPTDLGIVGVWFEFGLVGTAVIGIAMVYISCIQNIRRSTAVLGQVDARSLSLIGCVLGLNEVIPHELYVGSALIFSLILANTLYNFRAFNLIAGTMQGRRSQTIRRHRHRLPRASN